MPQPAERPPSLPAEAVWDEGDGEWVVAPFDADGKRHGLVTFWRPDGSLVNHCNFAHGVPHGWFKRYHETGEVSRAGEFVDGKIHGVDACYRASGPTTELAFPASRMPATVWRYEMDMVNGRMVSARWYDKDGQQVTETGEPYPARPAGVPSTAVYLSKSATWFDGATDDAGKRHGLWRTWSRDGALVAETEIEHGRDVDVRRFASPEDAAAIVALREGRTADALAAARAWWTRTAGGSAQDRIVAGDLYARALGDDPSTIDERRAVLRAVADEPGVAWVFTAEGKRAYQAQAAALDWLARDALAAGRAGDAVALCDRAIATEFHYGPSAARVTKVAALRRLGRDDEAFSVARDLLLADPERLGLDDVRADPRFAQWLESIRTDNMTIDGAWEVLGRRGDQLETIGRVIAEAPPTESDGAEGADAADAHDVAWPLADVLAERLSPELARWGALAGRFRSTYRGHFTPAASSSIAAAVDARDGTWLARLEGLFLPVSVVLVEDEEIWHATWTAGADGTSQVYYTHQDEPGWWPHVPSLGALLALRILKDTAFEELHIAGAVKERWKRAVILLSDLTSAPPAPHLSVAALAPRTGWIVQHLLGVGHEHGIADAPGIETWEAERAHADAWPHLQAYWLLHHLVFDNREELPALVAIAERRHPAVGELAAIAEAVLAGEAHPGDGEAGASVPTSGRPERPGGAPPGWWDETKVRGLRARASDAGHARVMTAPAQARLRAALAERDAAAAEAAAARDALAASGDAAVARVLDTFGMLESVAGKLAGFEQSILDRAFSDEDERMDFFMRQKNGHTSILMRAIHGMLDDVGPACRPLFEAAVRRGAAFEEEHSAAVPGALAGLGGASADFAEVRAHAEALIGAERIGRRRRMELALVAARRFDQPAARAFLVHEAERYARQLAEARWQVDTVAFSLFRLFELEPDTGGRILAGALSDARFSGANWRPAILLVEEAGRRAVAAASPGILAAIDRGLGRYDDGDRTTVVRAYAACAGAAAAGVLETRYAAIDDSRADCARCAFVAAFIDLDPASPRWRDEARAVLARLLAGRMGSMENGAAISLFRAIFDAKVPGFAELAGQVQARVNDDKYTKARHKAWLAEAVTKLAAPA
jgi:antitoxin component YwqK of YwqJK toxin-antitoxin module